MTRTSSQSLSAPTEWAPLADCSWTEDGLITPAAAEILQQQRSPAPTALSEDGRRWSGSVPANVTRFALGLEAAQRAGTVDHVRRLCDGSGPFLEGLDAASRAVAEDALAEARSWLSSHEDYQQRVFADLAQAVSERRAFDVRSQMQIAETLTRRAASSSEEKILASARAFLRAQNNLPSDAPALSRRSLAPAPRRRPAAQERPRTASVSKDAADPGSRWERRRRRDAATQVRGLLSRLRQSRLSKAEELEVITELASAAQLAGDELSSGERRRARSFTRKLPQARSPLPRNQPAPTRASRRESERPPRRELAPNVLESAAAAVRGALKKAARERRATSWGRLEEQLGSALPRMELADRVRVLSLVDQHTPSEQPLLSSLVAAGDSSMMAPYRTVAADLGLEVPSDDDDLRDVLHADVERAYQHWRFH